MAPWTLKMVLDIAGIRFTSLTHLHIMNTVVTGRMRTASAICGQNCNTLP